MIEMWVFSPHIRLAPNKRPIETVEMATSRTSEMPPVRRSAGHKALRTNPTQSKRPMKR